MPVLLSRRLTSELLPPGYLFVRQGHAACAVRRGSARTLAADRVSNGEKPARGSRPES